MKISDHLEKAKAFERALTKLDRLLDGELYAVFLMRAGTNRLNAALHALDVTTDGAPTSVKLGDLNHTYKPKLASGAPAQLKEAFSKLAYIENLRPVYVRGAKALDAQAAGEAEAALAVIRRDTDAIIKRGAL